MPLDLLVFHMQNLHCLAVILNGREHTRIGLDIGVNSARCATPQRFWGCWCCPVAIDVLNLATGRYSCR